MRTRSSADTHRTYAAPRAVAPRSTPAYGRLDPTRRRHAGRSLGTRLGTRGIVWRVGAPGGSRRATKKALISRADSDGETRTRTGDTTIFSRVLYQLSYLAVMG